MGIINSDAVSDEEKFEFEVERMISLMKRSREVIATSEKRYQAIDELLTEAYNELKALKYFLEDLKVKALASAGSQRKNTDIACGFITTGVGIGLLTLFNVILPGIGTGIAIPLTALTSGLGCWGGVQESVKNYENAISKKVATSLRALEL